MASVFRGTLEFFNELGMYDVILPFILVFTIVYGILEKTKLLGTTKIEGVETPQKGLNAIVSFSVGLLFIGSLKIVENLQAIIAQVVLLLMLPVLFLILVGTFHVGGGEFKLGKGWQKIFYIILFLGIILIFLGQFGFLDMAYDWVLKNWDSKIFTSLAFLAFVVGIIALVVAEPGGSKKKEKKSED